MVDPTNLKIHFRKSYPLHHIQPVGLLPKTEESAALWQFLLMATQALGNVESQKTLEGEEDQAVDMMQLAHSARRIFELESLDGMFHMELVALAKRECVRTKLPWDSRLDAFFESGGRAYRWLDRDADKISN